MNRHQFWAIPSIAAVGFLAAIIFLRIQVTWIVLLAIWALIVFTLSMGYLGGEEDYWEERCRAKGHFCKRCGEPHE